MPGFARTFRVLLLLGCLLLQVGCATHERTYPGQSAEQVWAAMVAVAEVPDYTGDWHVTGNIVTTDHQEGIIDVNRSLRRTVLELSGERRTEQRDWQFRFMLLPAQSPTVAFVARNPALPMHVHVEADRFFTDLATVLAGVERDVAPPDQLLRVPPDPADDPTPILGEPQ